MTKTLWLDSSVIRLGARKLRALAELAQSKGVSVLVHAHIHLEMCRYRRERHGERFSPSYVDSFLDQHGIQVATVMLDRVAAETWAALLHQRYPTRTDWKQAKLSAVRARLPDNALIREDHVPITTDWLVALEIERQGAYVAVGDKGEEWAALRSTTPCRALSYDDSIQWLRNCTPAQPPPPSRRPTRFNPSSSPARSP